MSKENAERMVNMKKVGLVLEGGGERGVFTSGVLDYMMEEKFWLPYVIGVSAGACNAVDYVSRQPYRTKQCMIDSQKKYDLYSARNILKTGYYINMDLIFNQFPTNIYPFDFETYASSGSRCLMTVTNCVTGRPEYIEETKDSIRMMAACRASSSLPFVSPMVKVDGKPMMDGGLTDSIPIQKATKDGFKYNILVLTRPKGYRKSSERPGKTVKVARRVYKDYPMLVKALALRNHRYNKTMEIIEQLEAKGRVFVIRPTIPCVGRTEKNIGKLEHFYEHGYETMKKEWPKLQEWLRRTEKM